MKNTIKASLVMISCILIQQGFLRADEECCGGEVLPAGMVCCEDEAVLPDECCNDVKLPTGEECCKDADPEAAYNPDTTCCTDVGLIAKGAALSYQYMLEHCPDYTYRTNFIPSPNGCSNPIDVGANEFFYICCNGHDIGYATCKKSKSSNDAEFFSCMAGECFTNALVLEIPGCLVVAALYHDAVDLLGTPYYEAAQAQACQCCE